MSLPATTSLPHSPSPVPLASSPSSVPLCETLKSIKWTSTPSSVLCADDGAHGRAVNTRNHWRPPFPNPFMGEEKRFDDAGMLSARGPYVQGQRMAWAPFFAVNRCLPSARVSFAV